MEGMREAEIASGVTLPPGMNSFVHDDRDACRLADGEILRLPFPPLTFQQIAEAKAVADDWEIPEGLVPIIGDFHDLVCLDYRRSEGPSVVLIDDDRNEMPLFGSLDEFCEALCVVPERASSSIKRVVEKDSWLEF